MSFVVQVPVSSRNSLYNSVYSRCCTEISRLPCTDKSREWDQTPPGSISRDIVSQLIQGRRRNESGVWINVLKWDPTQAAAAPLFNSCKNFHPIFKRREEKNASTRDCTCAVDTHSTKGEIVVGRATRKKHWMEPGDGTRRTHKEWKTKTSRSTERLSNSYSSKCAVTLSGLAADTESAGDSCSTSSTAHLNMGFKEKKEIRNNNKRQPQSVKYGGKQVNERAGNTYIIYSSFSRTQRGWNVQVERERETSAK